MRYVAIIDGNEGNYGVTFHDLPGCTAMGDTLDLAMAHAAAALDDWAASYLATEPELPAPSSADAVRREYAEDLAKGAMLTTVGLVRGSGKPVRANMSLDSGVLAAIDAEAERRSLTRSGFVEAMARQVIPAMG